MVFVKSWDDFESVAEGIYTRSPDNSRFSVKYSHKNGEIVLKLTDNVKCVQYKTDIMPDLRKIEKFTGHLMGQMATTD